MRIESGTSVFDLALMLEGGLDNLTNNILVKYQITSLDSDISNFEISETYNTANQFVNQLFINSKKVSTLDVNIFDILTTGAFDDGFDDGFDSL